MNVPGTMTALVLGAGWLAWATPGGGLAAAGAGDGSPPTNAVTPNEFEGSDVERINRAIEVAASSGRRVVIPRENIQGEVRSNLWLLDSAILLRSNTTLELDNCRIKLSDRCRDNLMRNVKAKGVTTNLHVRGLGAVVLEGADHPRATGGGGGWVLGKHTYGTDGGASGEKPGDATGNDGILLRSVEDFILENFTIKDSHAVAIYLHQCARGTLRDLGLASLGYKMIDGVRQRILNQDGIDLRNGCHDILVENITGHTGDDLIALVGPAVSGRYRGGGDIHHITIRNIRGYSAGACNIIRLLNFGGLKIHDILIDGLTDTTPVDRQKGDLTWGPSCAAVGIGNPGYGGVTPLGDTYNVTIRNVISRARHAVLIAGSLSESSISNVVHHGTNDPVTVQSGPQYVRDVTIENARKISSDIGPVAD